MVLSVHWEVIYANVGSVVNPQPRVIGVKCRFGAPKDLVSFKSVSQVARVLLNKTFALQHQELRCHGAPQSCEAEQQVEISTSVSFVDVTQPAVDMYKGKLLKDICNILGFWNPLATIMSLSSHFLLLIQPLLSV